MKDLLHWTCKVILYNHTTYEDTGPSRLLSTNWRFTYDFLYSQLFQDGGLLGQTVNMSPGQHFFGCEVSPLLKEMMCGVPRWWLRSSYGVFVSMFNFALN